MLGRILIGSRRDQDSAFFSRSLDGAFGAVPPGERLGGHRNHLDTFSQNQGAVHFHAQQSRLRRLGYPDRPAWIQLKTASWEELLKAIDIVQRDEPFFPGPNNVRQAAFILIIQPPAPRDFLSAKRKCSFTSPWATAIGTLANCWPFRPYCRIASRAG